MTGIPVTLRYNVLPPGTPYGVKGIFMAEDVYHKTFKKYWPLKELVEEWANADLVYRSELITFTETMAQAKRLWAAETALHEWVEVERSVERAAESERQP